MARNPFKNMSTFVSVASKRDLFGGAIEANLGAEYLDVSDVRQVPDHQEVFIHKDNEVSIIVELLQYESDLEDNLDAVRHYYNDLVEVNEASENKILSEAVLTAEESFLPNLGKDVVKMAIVGKQTVGKYSTRPGMQIDHIYVVFVLVRLVNVGTELFISMNIPAAALVPTKREGTTDMPVDEAHRAALQELEERMNVQQLLSSGAFEATAHAPGSDALGTCFHDLRSVLSSFKINDWSLFGGGEEEALAALV